MRNFSLEQPLLQLNHLMMQRNGKALLVSPLSQTFHRAQLWQITGPNGSGKTSLLRTLAGFLLPQAGQIVRQHAGIFYMGHQVALYPELTPLENLTAATLGRVSQATLKAALAYWSLSKVMNRCCGELSAGQQRKVKLSHLCFSGAELWLLDEPLTALDASSQEGFWALIKQQAASRVILLTHHGVLPCLDVSLHHLCLAVEANHVA